ncbi:MAG: ATP-binding protein [Candidatus Sabulitectum sp.]|nr:ATP-binding protein [Candidatus Sabulitectum sp.]
MLISFTVSNYLSFKDETILNMMPGKSDSMKNHLLVDTANKSTELLPFAVMHGSNASGKSNLIAALSFMKNLVLRGVVPGAETGVIPFMLDRRMLKEPSKFEVVFRQDDVVYTYGFVASRERIFEEWLFGYFSNQESLIFERVTSDTGKAMIKCGGRLLKEKGKKFLEVYASGTRQEKLFITEAFAQNTKTVEPVIQWFYSSLVIITPATAFISIELTASHNSDFRSFLENFLRSANTGIIDVVCSEELFVPTKHLRDLPRDTVADIITELSLQGNGMMNVNMPGATAILRKTENTIMYLEMRFGHAGADGEVFHVKKDMESDGTKRLIEIALVLDAARSRDIVLVVDSLCRNLHTPVTKFFIQTFLAEVLGNGQKSQLIFTTHDTNLLDKALFREDEIWFLEKDKEGASHISSLGEFKQNKGHSSENGSMKPHREFIGGGETHLWLGG